MNAFGHGETLTQEAEKLQTLIKAANIEDVESIWTTLFAKVKTLYSIAIEYLMIGS